MSAPGRQGSQGGRFVALGEYTAVRSTEVA